MIYEFTPGDVKRISRIHTLAFKDFFLTKLGSFFLERYYQSIAMVSGSIFLVEKEEFARGFVCGIEDAGRFNRFFFQKNKVFLGVVIFAAVIRHPVILLRLLTRSKDNNHFPHRKGCIHLLSIAVHPDYSGLGYGSLLIKEFVRIARMRGYSLIYLTTDKENNDDVNSFYIRNGFVKTSEYNSGNKRMMNEYQMLLE